MRPRTRTGHPSWTWTTSASSTQHAVGARSVEALDGVSLTVDRGGNAGDRRRVGLWQDDPAALDRRPDRRRRAGAIRLGGQDLARRAGASLQRCAAELGMVFQDPQASLNPRRRVGRALEKALRARGLGERRGAARGRAAARAGRLGAESGQALPARALRRGAPTRGHRPRACRPAAMGGASRDAGATQDADESRLVLLDEPVSSLDASIRRGVIELLERAAGRARLRLRAGIARLHDGRSAGRPDRRHARWQDRRAGRRARACSSAPRTPTRRSCLAARCPVAYDRTRGAGEDLAGAGRLAAERDPWSVQDSVQA